MKQLLKKYGHAWLLSYMFIYLAWFSFLEKNVTSKYHVMHVSLDDKIPFNEYFVIPYLLWFFYVAVVVLYFFFTSKEDYYRLCAFLFSGMTISLIICTLYPNGTDLRPVVNPDKNICSWLVSLIHKADTSTNVFPSIHTFNAIVIHFSIINSETLKYRSKLRFCSFALAIAICLSTVYLKQHSVVDVVGATVLAYAIYPLVYNRAYLTSKKTVRERQNVTG